MLERADSTAASARSAARCTCAERSSKRRPAECRNTSSCLRLLVPSCSASRTTIPFSNSSSFRRKAASASVTALAAAASAASLRCIKASKLARCREAESESCASRLSRRWLELRCNSASCAFRDASTFSVLCKRFSSKKSIFCAKCSRRCRVPSTFAERSPDCCSACSPSLTASTLMLSVVLAKSASCALIRLSLARISPRTSVVFDAASSFGTNRPSTAACKSCVKRLSTPCMWLVTSLTIFLWVASNAVLLCSWKRVSAFCKTSSTTSCESCRSNPSGIMPGIWLPKSLGTTLGISNAFLI
mmetsp:Transcript_20355/g.59021  ORF Transcript_20355/g.59021 Transcript_20355/m.59021 type:complete len:303 (+) Transcript_20355:271-1179(+)